MTMLFAAVHAIALLRHLTFVLVRSALGMKAAINPKSSEGRV